MTYTKRHVIGIVMLMAMLLPAGIISGQTGSGSPDTITISGTVTDPSGEPVIGAGVQVKGTTEGTVTDISGKYTLHTEAGATITVSCIGYTDNSFEVTPPQCL